MTSNSNIISSAVLILLSLTSLGVLALFVWLYGLYRRDIAARGSMNRPWAEYEVELPRPKNLHVALFYWGSRGDFQPLAVLAQHLKREGHSVIVNVRELNYAAALSLGLHESELFLQLDDRPEQELAKRLQGQGGLQMIYHLFKHITHHSPSFLEQLDQMLVRSQADILIASEFAANVGMTAAEKHKLPMFVFRYSPLFISTPSWICPMFGKRDLGGFVNWLSYTLPVFIRMYIDAPVLRRLRAQRGLAPRAALSYVFGRKTWQYPSLLGYSGSLMPVPVKDMAPWSCHCGPLLPPAQEETETVPPALIEFLAANPAGQPIIYIGFGSFSLAQFLPRARAERAARDMLGVVEDLGIRAVLLNHTFDFMQDDPVLQNPRWYMAERFPHSWLFPRMSVLVHQGGAGHSSASARSGTPTVVIPIFEEQSFNAGALVAAGVAVKLDVKDLSRESFRSAFAQALSLQDRSRLVGEQVEREVQSSGSIAVAWISRWLSAQPEASGGARREEAAYSARQ